MKLHPEIESVVKLVMPEKSLGRVLPEPKSLIPATPRLSDVMSVLLRRLMGKSPSKTQFVKLSVFKVVESSMEAGRAEVGQYAFARVTDSRLPSHEGGAEAIRGVEGFWGLVNNIWSEARLVIEDQDSGIAPVRYCFEEM